MVGGSRGSSATSARAFGPRLGWEHQIQGQLTQIQNQTQTQTPTQVFNLNTASLARNVFTIQMKFPSLVQIIFKDGHTHTHTRRHAHLVILW